MTFSNVKLIFLREIRDQMRDRRTLFTIVVLPVLLYPLMGMTMMQISNALKKHPTRILIVGAAGLTEDPALIVEAIRPNEEREFEFAGEFCPSSERKLMVLTVEESSQHWSEKALGKRAKEQIQRGQFDAFVYFPDEFAQKLSEFRESLVNKPAEATDGESHDGASVPQPVIFANMSIEKSRIAHMRVQDILERWHDAIVRQNLRTSRVPVAVTRPFKVADKDIADVGTRGVSLWAKILPFVVLIWALTGAFYPAIDLCAGEKERGTLETLLTSPAERNEIVLGKLLTIMTFSMATSLLNLLSMGFTGLIVLRQLAQSGTILGPTPIGPPPFASIAWIVLALIPISALFSALSLAIAAFARSSKEGQYYLMPLLLISLPLMMLPMLPTAELDLGMSLIPVTGMMLLLRNLIEGQYLEALRFAVPVIGVTSVCCWLSIRWAVNQFNDESVLFRESERWGIGLWFRQLVRDRGILPTFGEALMCGVILLMIRFFAGLLIPMPTTWRDFVTSTAVLQIALIATPALLMAIMLTRSPRKTLQLQLPSLASLPAAVLFAVLLHPSVLLMGSVIRLVYPISEDTQEALAGVSALFAGQPIIYVLLLIALLPAICEELAFRGFMLSGFRHLGNKRTAIIMSSLFFGIIHSQLQQSIAAFAVGILIGYIVVQSRSIFTGMLFHFTHNSLAILVGYVTPERLEQTPILKWLYFTTTESGVTGVGGYHWPVVAVTGFFAVAILLWFRGLPYVSRFQSDTQSATEHGNFKFGIPSFTNIVAAEHLDPVRNDAD